MPNIILSPKVIEEIAKKVAGNLKKEKNKVTKEKRDWRLRNTRLLLKNYRMLDLHCKGIEAELFAYEEVVYDSDALDLHALMKYKAKTARMLLYFDEMFNAYGNYCGKAGEATKRRFEVIDRLYVSNNELTPDEVAELFNINHRTVYKDADKAIEELSIFLFGIDSLQDLQRGQKEGNTRA